jgi:hypothetical protein
MSDPFLQIEGVVVRRQHVDGEYIFVASGVGSIVLSKAKRKRVLKIVGVSAGVPAAPVVLEIPLHNITKVEHSNIQSTSGRLLLGRTHIWASIIDRGQEEKFTFKMSREEHAKLKVALPSCLL